MNFIQRLRIWFVQRSCDHDWEPALLKGQPCKHCELCKKNERLSREEFYAQFGTIPEERIGFWMSGSR
jgi:hypothetical protein